MPTLFVEMGFPEFLPGLAMNHDPPEEILQV
jgi:hypothetical protein